MGCLNRDLSEQGWIPEVLASDGRGVGRSLESRPALLKLELAQEAPGDLVTMVQAGLVGLGRDRDAAFLTSSQVMLMLLVWATF